MLEQGSPSLWWGTLPSVHHHRWSSPPVTEASSSNSVSSSPSWGNEKLFHKFGSYSSFESNCQRKVLSNNPWKLLVHLSSSYPKKFLKIISKVCIPRFSGERLRREGDSSSPQVLLSKCPRSLRFLNESVCENIINGFPLKAVWEETSVTSADPWLRPGTTGCGSVMTAGDWWWENWEMEEN